MEDSEEEEEELIPGRLYKLKPEILIDYDEDSNISIRLFRNKHSSVELDEIRTQPSSGVLVLEVSKNITKVVIGDSVGWTTQEALVWLPGKKTDGVPCNHYRQWVPCVWVRSRPPPKLGGYRGWGTPRPRSVGSCTG